MAFPLPLVGSRSKFPFFVDISGPQMTLQFFVQLAYPQTKVPLYGTPNLRDYAWQDIPPPLRGGSNGTEVLLLPNPATESSQHNAL